MENKVNILFIADIVGGPGLQITEKMLPYIKKKYGIDFCIGNGENVSEGKGISQQDYNHLLNMGIDLLTSGNHIWETFKSVNVLRKEKLILRPSNYPDGNPGHGSTIIGNKKGQKIGVINLQGRTFMIPIDNPFQKANEIVEEMKRKCSTIIVDFHAEATAEKITMGWHLDGKVSAVIGTHTHVQTADERILPNGTAYITDIGMTGSIDSVIGMKKDVALHRFIYGTNKKYSLAKENLRFCGIVITLDSNTGKAINVERINLP